MSIIILANWGGRYWKAQYWWCRRGKWVEERKMLKSSLITSKFRLNKSHDTYSRPVEDLESKFRDVQDLQGSLLSAQLHYLDPPYVLRWCSRPIRWWIDLLLNSQRPLWDVALGQLADSFNTQLLHSCQSSVWVLAGVYPVWFFNYNTSDSLIIEVCTVLPLCLYCGSDKYHTQRHQVKLITLPYGSNPHFPMSTKCINPLNYSCNCRLRVLLL